MTSFYVLLLLALIFGLIAVVFASMGHPWFACDFCGVMIGCFLGMVARAIEEV